MFEHLVWNRETALGQPARCVVSRWVEASTQGRLIRQLRYVCVQGVTADWRGLPARAIQFTEYRVASVGLSSRIISACNKQYTADELGDHYEFALYV